MYRKPEILRATVSHVLEALNQQPPTDKEVTTKHKDLNDQIVALAQNLAGPGKEPSPQNWEAAYSEILEAEITAPMRELGEIQQQANPWELTLMQQLEVEQEIMQEEALLATMTPDQQAQYWVDQKTEWEKLKLSRWLASQPDPQFEDPEIVKETTELLWKQIQADPSSDPRLNAQA